ncbi:hypothetical protein EG329_000745 [Mollisiaceae sp. DMI_Dod_QoI]|nr:hypothetical protein EG329_000745 [Helotiales sp. DMI_Dod_QoI]
MSERLETASLARGLALRPTDVLIAVMGVTGSGKSTFISLCSEQQLEIGHTLQACTSKVDVYSFPYSPTTTVFLIDTPGFDDTNRNDTEILREIAGWLTESYSNKVKLNGILYLHRISDVRMPGSAKKNLMMFKKLCGEDALKNVILGTTMWDKVTTAQGEERELQLTSTPDFWGWMISKGSVVHRHAGDRQSAMRLLEHFIRQESQVVLSLQHEMVEEHKNLNETLVGMTIQDDLIKEREKYQKELSEVEKSMKDAIRERDHEAAQAMRELRDDYHREMERLNMDRQKLKTDMENLHAQKSEELLKRLEEQQKAHAEDLRRNEIKWSNENALLKQQLASLTEMNALKISPTTSNQPSSSSTPPVSDDTPLVKGLRVNRKWRIGPVISRDHLVYEATNILSLEKVAVKLEPLNDRHPRLENEAHVYKSLAGSVAVPSVLWIGAMGEYTAMVFDRLGLTLEELFNLCDRKFSLKTVLLIADQLISRLESLHAKSFIHRNLRPEYFQLSNYERGKQISLTTYSLAKKYRDRRTRMHIPSRENKSFVGNRSFASINSHLGAESSRRDDMESLGYILLYFLGASLPWRGLKTAGKTKNEENALVVEKKTNTPVKTLCRGFPEEFEIYLNYTQSLSFDEKPDYRYLRSLFRDLSVLEGFSYDYNFDWVKLKHRKN